MSPSYVVSVDLGKRVSGIAMWCDGVLVAATEIRARPTPVAMARALCDWVDHYVPAGTRATWVVETMVEYGPTRGRRRDLAHLTKVAEALRRMVGKVVEYTANEWKGTTPKFVTAIRVQRRLSEDELDRVDVFGKESVDALGIGLYHLGRVVRGVRAPRGHAVG